MTIMTETTLYTSLPRTLYTQLAQVKLLVCDVDGVFSDGRIYLGNAGEELKAFHTRDGYGVKALVKAGIPVAVITGRRSAIVENRMKALNVDPIIQGEENKADALQDLMRSLSLSSEHVAAVNDAHPTVKAQANWVLETRGGFGAVREICDTLLQVHGKLHGIHGASV